MLHLARAMEALGDLEWTEDLYRLVIDIGKKCYDEEHASIACAQR